MLSTELPRWDIYFTVEGPTTTSEVPSLFNPQDGPLKRLLAALAENLPPTETLGLELIGVRVVRSDNDQGATNG